MSILWTSQRDKIVARGSFSTALLDEADLVEYGKNKVRSMPAAAIKSLVQRLNASREAIFIGGFVVRKNLVIDPLISLVLSKIFTMVVWTQKFVSSSKTSSEIWQPGLDVFRGSPILKETLELTCSWCPVNVRLDLVDRRSVTLKLLIF